MTNPVEDFLMRMHPEAMEIGKVLLNGEEVEFGTPNKPLLRKLIHEHFDKGQEVLKDFKKWLIRHEAVKEKDAATTVATVWNALCLTYDDKTEQSDVCRLLATFNETYVYSGKMRICAALRYWARFRKDSQLYETLIVWMKRGKPDTAPQYVLDELQTSPPHTKQEYRKLLKSLEEHRGMPRMPWAYPCLKLVFTCGINPGEVMCISKDRMLEARQRGFLTVQAKGKHNRLLPMKIIGDSLDILLAFPWEWGTVDDLVRPGAKQTYSGTYLLKNAAKLVYKRARVDFTPTWSTRLRWTASWLYYQKTKNLVGAAQIMGVKRLNRVSEFIEELKRRAAKQEASTVVDSEDGSLDESCVSE